MAVEFYSVKARAKVQVPEADVRKVVYETKGGTRYGLKGTYEGATVTKFISKADYEKSEFPEG